MEWIADHWDQLFEPVLWLLTALALPPFARAGVRLLERRLDHAVPDDMPEPAGSWAAAMAEERLPGVSVVAAPDTETDRYLPQASSLVLSRTTYFKSDPIFWAGAARGLGHAWIWRRTPKAGAAVEAARVLSGWLLSASAILLAVNLFRHQQLLMTVASSCLWVSLGCNVIVVAAEAVSAVYARRLLLADERVTGAPRLVGLWLAPSAMMAELVSLLGKGLLLWAWPTWSVLLEATPITPASYSLTPTMAVVLLVLSLPLVVTAFLDAVPALASADRLEATVEALAHRLRIRQDEAAAAALEDDDPDDPDHEEEDEVNDLERARDKAGALLHRLREGLDAPWEAVAGLLLAVVWDFHGGSAYALATALAAMSLSTLFGYFLMPGTVVATKAGALATMPLAMFLEWAASRAEGATNERFLADASAGEAGIALGRKALEEAATMDLVAPSWMTRLAGLNKLMILPLIAMAWFLGLAG